MNNLLEPGKYQLISIIIPTTRPEAVLDALNSVYRQIKQEKVRAEVIVAGRGLESLSVKYPRIRLAGADHKMTAPEARNHGFRISRGDIILFLDDDCLIPENFFSQSLKYLFQLPNVGAIGAKIISKNPTFFAKCVDYTNFWLQQNDQRRLTDQLYTAFLGIKRKVYEKTKGFNEKYTVGGEDVEFVNDLVKLGFDNYYVPAIVILHNHRRETWRDFTRYMYKNGVNLGLASQKNYIGRSRSAIKAFKICYPLLILPLTLAYTGATTVRNLGYDSRVLLYLPFIFVGYFLLNLGILINIITKGGFIE